MIFAELALSPALHSVVAELGFETLTPIQARAIPVLLQGQDLLGQAATGSGKTAAYAIPILERLCLTPVSLQALVLCPTRELSAQVVRNIRKLGRRHAGLGVVLLTGGEPARPQAQALTRGIHVAVGTPGRMLDHLRRGTLSLQQLTTVVLDEADRMLDMGFRDDVEGILRALPETRQTVLFSATLPQSVQALAKEHQREAVCIRDEAGLQQKPDIRQLRVEVPLEEKLQVLINLISQLRCDSALVFANFKRTVADLEDTLSKAGVSVAALHGDLEQPERERVLAKFRNGSTRVLVATDVAARGLDVEGLDLVVNFELPEQPLTYVHRIGRTGRAGNPGLAVALCSPHERSRLTAIEQAIGHTLRPLTDSASPGSAPGTLGLELSRPASMDTLRVSGGRKHKLRPSDILGALTGASNGVSTGAAAGAAGVWSASDIGKIEIHDRWTYVAVSKQVSRVAAQLLNARGIKGKKFRVTRLD